jgi:hypothetical protein
MRIIWRYPQRRAVPNWLSWLIAIFRGWLTARADIQAKQEQQVGQVKQKNADLTAALQLSEAQRKAMADAPDEKTALKEGNF